MIAAVVALLLAAAAVDQSASKASGRKTTRRRPRGAAADLRRLADLVVLLDRRRERRGELAAKLDALRRATLMTVVGEEALLTAVDARLQEAGRLLAEIDEAGEAVDAQLDALEQVLAGYEWDVVEQTLPLLDQKRSKQDEIIRQLQEDVDGWKKRLEPLRTELAEARAANAPVPMERAALERMDGLVRQAERALLDQRHADVAEPLARLAAEDLDALSARVREKTENALRFRGQADVLLLQAPGGLTGTHAYTVLLRTPSERGSHGINIQDSSSLVDQDREYIRASIAQVTEAVNAGIQRRFQMRGSEPPPPPEDGAAASTATATSAEPAASELREWNPQAAQPGDPAAPLANDSRALIGDVGNVMFRLFMPDRMRQYLSSTPCALTITTNDLELPWELMYDSSWEESDSEQGLGFLCLQRPIARMPMGKAFPRVQRNPAQRKARLRFLLVYADPDENLPAAGKEVEQIERALSERWSSDLVEIKLLDGGTDAQTGERREKATGEQINRALLSGTYDVIHFAGHAHFNKDDPDLSGLLLDGREICFSQKIQRFVEGKPLVFLNACETGITANEDAPQSVGEYFWKPAEGLASAFLYGGALGCVGSLWPIYDGPAADFAIEFYNQLLEGQMIGEAMRLTRRSIKQKHPESITWASFVLYGDPTFRLVE